MGRRTPAAGACPVVESTWSLSLSHPHAVINFSPPHSSPGGGEPPQPSARARAPPQQCHEGPVSTHARDPPPGQLQNFHDHACGRASTRGRQAAAHGGGVDAGRGRGWRRGGGGSVLGVEAGRGWKWGGRAGTLGWGPPGGGGTGPGERTRATIGWEGRRRVARGNRGESRLAMSMGKGAQHIWGSHGLLALYSPASLCAERKTRSRRGAGQRRVADNGVPEMEASRARGGQAGGLVGGEAVRVVGSGGTEAGDRWMTG